MDEHIPNCFYRISVKALVLDEIREKFLIMQEENGCWEFPGGGLEWGVSPHDDLPREISEEMGLKVTSIAKDPCYFLTMKRRGTDEKPLIANVSYETTLENLDFTPSDECVALKFVTKEEAKAIDCFAGVAIMGEMFDPKKHQ